LRWPVPAIGMATPGLNWRLPSKKFRRREKRRGGSTTPRPIADLSRGISTSNSPGCEPRKRG
jgi:hypothetical protein